LSDTHDNSGLRRGSASLPSRLRQALPADRAVVRLFVITVAVLVIMALLNPGRFLTYRNFASMCFQFPELGIFSLAVMLSLVTGGIDLSVVSIGNLTGILAALILTRAAAEPSVATLAACIAAAIVAALATAIFCGWINGLLISRLAITPILATLGTMQLFMGISLVITEGHAIAGYPKAAQFVGNGTLAGIPVPLLLLLLLTCGVGMMLGRTRLGLHLYLMGTNPVAAKFSGLDVRRLVGRTYLLTALLSGIAGLVAIARTNSAKADYGSSYLLHAVLVAILGGVSPRGGFGSAWGVLLAVLSLQFLSSGLNMLQLNETVGPYINNFAKEFTWGALLLVVMAVNRSRAGSK
jgi:simple sugar transport system permease protein